MINNLELDKYTVWIQPNTTKHTNRKGIPPSQKLNKKKAPFEMEKATNKKAMNSSSFFNFKSNNHHHHIYHRLGVTKYSRERASERQMERKQNGY